MINYFLEAHLKLFNEKKKLLDIIYNTNINFTKAYNHIINTNFTSEQIQSLFYYFFKDNLSYRSFEKFRNILIKPLNNIFEFFVKSNYFNVKIINKNKYNFYDNIINSHKKNNINENDSDECLKLINIEKMVFISYQYHNILDYKLKIMDMLDETLEKIKIKLIKTCELLKNIIDNESEDWEYIFKAMQQINNGIKKKIYKLKKKFNIEYGDIYYKSSCIKIPNEPDQDGIELRKYYEKCKEEYYKLQKPKDSNENVSCVSYYLCAFNKCNNSLIDYNKKDIQGLIKNYMSKSLIEISNLIKSKIIKNQLIDILELIPEKKKFLQNIINTNLLDEIYYPLSYKKKKSINVINYKPILYISPITPLFKIASNAFTVSSTCKNPLTAEPSP